MKKFWIVLLALGLVAGFAMSASAADVKFGGSYYVTGLYTDKHSLNENNYTAIAFYMQRLRVETTFKVAEGLNLVTRFDALERRWGDNRWMGTGDTYNRLQGGGAAVQIQENIEFERAYLDFTTKIGRFMVGYMNFVSWGTTFHDTNLTRAGIKYFIPIGPLTVIAAIEKGQGGDNVNIGTASDADNNVYDLGVVYKFGIGDAGIIYQKGLNKTARPTAGRYSDLNFILPYAKLKFGPVYVEGEALYGFGELRRFEDGVAGQNVSGTGAGLYLHAKGDIGPAYVGGRFVWLSGDDRTTTDKVEGNLMTALLSGDAFNPCLLLWNDEYTKWVGQILGNTAAGVNPLTGSSGGVDTYMENIWFYQVYGGIKPVKDLDIMASLTYAYSDKKNWTTVAGTASSPAVEFVSNTYGTELDLTVTYKIFDNLQYMVGGAYLWTGDLFKGIDPNFKIANNYLLMHKLTLSF